MKLEDCKPGQRVAFTGWYNAPISHGLITDEFDFRRRRVRVEWYSLQSGSSPDARSWVDPLRLRLEAQQP